MNTNTSCCDRCGRSLDGKGWIEVSGWKICGICQWEEQMKSTPPQGKTFIPPEKWITPEDIFNAKNPIE
jgi:hypothetical protein